jgi:Ca2+-transporting ATPase
VLARRSAVVESLGGATVLCVDKTGTLTENHMQVARIWAAGQDMAVSQTPDPAAAEVLQLAVMASAVRPIDPMDRAVHSLLGDTPGSELAPEPERAWPLRPELMAVIQLWRGGGETRTAAAKGAPEAIFRLCQLPSSEVERLEAVVQAYAAQGLRVLGVASARGEGWFIDEPQSVAFEFAGLIGFLDPLRADVPAALREATGAGIAVIMLTGDHPSTALAIARAAGIDTSAGVLLGSEIADLPFETLCRKLEAVRVFARIAPEQKLRIVQALKAAGHVVAMTGDGVNDAPALEGAHICIAMGRRVTDVARDAADLVLVDDSFASIVGGVRLGRRIFANLRRALTYITAIHIPIAGVALAPILLGLPPLLFPMHVVLLELAIDPISALVFEAEPSEAEAMRRPPRRRDEALFGPAQLGLAALQGLGVFAGVLGLYWWALGDYPAAQARGAAFAALILGNLVLALTDSLSTGRLLAPHRRVFWLIAGAISGVLACVLAVPAFARLFGVELPDAALLGLALLVALTTGGWSLALRRRE